MIKGEFDVHRDLGYHGYPKTLDGLRHFEKFMEKMSKEKIPYGEHGYGFKRDNVKYARRTLKRIRQRIKALTEKTNDQKTDKSRD